MNIIVTRFFGDAEYTFALTDPMVTELERLSETGIGAVYKRTIAQDFAASDLGRIIRLGLIGGGMNPATAHELVETYAIDRPYAETFPLALDVLDARWSGAPDTPADDAKDDAA